MGGADDIVGDQMRQMGGDREHQVVMAGVITSTLAPSPSQKTFSRSRRRSLPRGGVRMHQRPSNSPAKPESGPGKFGAGNRVGGNEMDACGHVQRHVPHHRALDRTDIGHDRAGLDDRISFGDRGAGADGNAEDDEIGVLDGLDIGFQHAIDDAELHPPLRGFWPSAPW